QRATIYNRSRIDQIGEKLGDKTYRDPEYRALYRTLITARPDSTIEDITANLDEDSIATLEDILAEAAIHIDVDRTISDSLATLRARDLDQRAAELDRIIPLAEGAQKDRRIAGKDE